MIQLLQGDARDVLPTLPDASVQMVVTSPPYYGLRDYGTAQWEGGDAACEHKATPRERQMLDGRGNPGKNCASWNERDGTTYRDTCGKCGARRIDAQIGLEPTPDDWIATMVAVFRQLRRVLRDDGTIFCNMGDSFADKQLLMMPARLALALQADGWWLRSDIIWAKPNPMPESAKDRPTNAYEHIFLLTKRARYFYDAQAIAEAVQDVRQGSATRSVPSAGDRDYLARLQAMRDGSRQDMADDGDGPSQVAGSEQVTRGTSAHGPLFRVSEREGGDHASPCSETREEDGGGLHADAARVARDQGERRAQVPLLQQEDGPAVDGSCDPAEQGRPSRCIEHRSSVQELQQQERHPASHVALRNARNWWVIPTAPYATAHFATFPPELAERCIRAGTSERGCCAQCGAPWVRVTERVAGVSGEALGRPKQTAGMWDSSSTLSMSGHHGAGWRERGPQQSTTGWAPGCTCQAETRPCVVLDPFSGAGTALLVADRLGRDAIGIDLNHQYVEMTRERITADCPLFTSWAPAEEPEDERMRDLFAEAAE